MSRLSRIPNVDDVPMDPAIAAELEALDAALRGDAIDDESLAALVRDVKAQAPVMPTELREGLREDVAAGFPRGGLKGRLLRAPRGDRRPASGSPSERPRRRSFAYGSGFAVTAVLAVFVVSIAANSGGHDDYATVSSSEPALEQQTDAASAPAGTEQGDAYLRSGPTDQTGSPNRFGRDAGAESSSEAIPKAALLKALEQARSAAGASAPAIGELSPTAKSKTSTPASGKRRVERSVDMTVKVKSGKLSDAAGKVGDITRQAGGFVADSRVSAGSRGAGSATFTLQVASSKLDQAIGRLSDLGTVTSQDQASTDITSSFDSVAQRLGDAKTVRKALLRSLDKADSAGEIASLRSRIADNRGTIAGLESDKLALERRTNLTTVALSLTAPSGDAPDASDDGNWSIGDAARDAVDLLGTIVGVLLITAAGLLPFGILAAIAWGFYRVRRRHARDAALDA